MLLDEGAKLTGTLDSNVVQALYKCGLAYLDVPVNDVDNVYGRLCEWNHPYAFISVPPLDGFVMNRVLGDYFETLLYKIFVSIDEHTTVAEV